MPALSCVFSIVLNRFLSGRSTEKAQHSNEHEHELFVLSSEFKTYAKFTIIMRTKISAAEKKNANSNHKNEKWSALQY